MSRTPPPFALEEKGYQEEYLLGQITPKFHFLQANARRVGVNNFNKNGFAFAPAGPDYAKIFCRNRQENNRGKANDEHTQPTKNTSTTNYFIVKTEEKYLSRASHTRTHGGTGGTLDDTQYVRTSNVVRSIFQTVCPRAMLIYKIYTY